MEKVKRIIFFGIGAFLAIWIGWRVAGSPAVLINNWKLKQSVNSLKEGTSVFLNEVVPFRWDTLYTFGPYESREEIAKKIGFQSPDIKENNVNEGMVHLLFVRDHSVEASVLGYGSNLGYMIDFTSKEDYKITYDENARFTVNKKDGITELSYIK